MTKIELQRRRAKL